MALDASPGFKEEVIQHGSGFLGPYIESSMVTAALAVPAPNSLSHGMSQITLNVGTVVITISFRIRKLKLIQGG